jgi:hypothetical protein
MRYNRGGREFAYRVIVTRLSWVDYSDPREVAPPRVTCTSTHGLGHLIEERDA